MLCLALVVSSAYIAQILFGQLGVPFFAPMIQVSVFVAQMIFIVLHIGNPVSEHFNGQLVSTADRDVDFSHSVLTTAVAANVYHQHSRLILQDIPQLSITPKTASRRHQTTSTTTVLPSAQHSVTILCYLRSHSQPRKPNLKNNTGDCFAG